MTQLIKKRLKNKQTKRSKNGSEAMGTALSAVFIMMLIMIPIGLFVFVMPRITLEQDVNQFVNSVRLHGYVPTNVYNQFEETMMARGYSEQELTINYNNSDWIQVYAIDAEPVNINNDYPNNVSLIQSERNLNPPVISRGDGKIVVKVKLPANSGIFAKSVNQMNPDKDTQTGKQNNEDVKDKVRYYNIGREFMSEAYAGSGS